MLKPNFFNRKKLTAFLLLERMIIRVGDRQVRVNLRSKTMEYLLKPVHFLSEIWDKDNLEIFARKLVKIDFFQCFESSIFCQNIDFWHENSNIYSFYSQIPSNFGAKIQICTCLQVKIEFLVVKN